MVKKNQDKCSKPFVWRRRKQENLQWVTGQTGRARGAGLVTGRLLVYHFPLLHLDGKDTGLT